MLDLILEIIRGISAYLQYRYSPAMILRRDEINRQIAREAASNKIDRIIYDKETLDLSFFISQWLSLRRKIPVSTSRWTEDFFTRKLPRPRNEEDRRKDITEGFDGE